MLNTVNEFVAGVMFSKYSTKSHINRILSLSLAAARIHSILFYILSSFKLETPRQDPLFSVAHCMDQNRLRFIRSSFESFGTKWKCTEFFFFKQANRKIWAIEFFWEQKRNMYMRTKVKRIYLFVFSSTVFY